jgi:hypothetical protein
MPGVHFHGKGFLETKNAEHEHLEGEEGECQDARDATTRPSSWGSDGSSLAMSADQTEGKRMQRSAKTAMRKAMSMTNIMREGREGGSRWWSRERKTKKGMNELPPQSRNRRLSNPPTAATLSAFLSPLQRHMAHSTPNHLVTLLLLHAIRGH